MYSADLKDFYRYQLHPISLKIKGAEPVYSESTQGVFASEGSTEKYKKRGYLNYHRVVFKATAETARVIISDKPAPAGTELTLNFIEVEPYLMPE